MGAGEADRCNAELGSGIPHGTNGQQALLEIIVRQTSQAIFVCDIHRKITLANAAARQLAEIEPEGRSLDSLSQIWGEMLDERGVPIPAHRRPCHQALQGKGTMGRQCRLLRSGESRNFLFSAAPLRNEDERIVGAIASFVDVTHYSQQALARCQQAVRRERHRMAADLHDTLAQGLNAIVLQLQVAEEEFSQGGDEGLRHLRRATGIARETLAYARSSMWTLCDESHLNQHCDDQPGNLAPALSFLAQQLFAATSIKLTCSLEHQEHAMPPAMQVNLLRISREALANVLKHAQATTVHVTLAYKHGQVQLSIEDNGRGFVSAPSSNLHRSFGLNSMRERARRLGGTVIVASQPGRGTRVTALIPLAGAHKGDKKTHEARQRVPA
jgi:signal transduction histidine kinase